MHTKHRVRKHIDSQQVKGAERLLETARQTFVIFFDHSEKKISSKSSFLVVSEILRLIVIILTTDEKYSLSVKASV